MEYEESRGAWNEYDVLPPVRFYQGVSSTWRANDTVLQDYQASDIMACAAMTVQDAFHMSIWSQNVLYL